MDLLYKFCYGFFVVGGIIFVMALLASLPYFFGLIKDMGLSMLFKLFDMNTYTNMLDRMRGLDVDTKTRSH